MFEDSIFFNNEARIEINDNQCYEPIGNNTEVALLKFLQNAGVPLHRELVKCKTENAIAYQIPFSTKDKFSAVAVEYASDSKIRIFVKGAHEKVLPWCNSTFDKEGNATYFGEQAKQTLEDEVIT